jgi:hypothetical protein
MTSGVSLTKVVATIDVPAMHHGSERPERKNCSTSRPARRAKTTPTVRASRM